MKEKITYEAVIKNQKLLKEIYDSYQNNFENTYNIAKNFNLTIEDYIKCVCFYIKNYTNYPTVANILNELLLLEDENDIISYLEKMNYSYETLKSNIPSYVINYRPDLLYDKEKINDLNIKLDMYKKYKQNLKIISEKKTINPFFQKNVMDFIASNYSLRRFCLQRNIGLKDFKKHINEIKSLDPSLYKAFIESNQLKETIKSENIRNIIISILNTIKNKDSEFDSIDYFLLTTYTPHEILYEADKLINSKDSKLMHIFISKYRTITVYSEYTIQDLLKEKLTIFIDGNSIEVKEENKLEIFNYLNEHDIPISATTYRDACIRYYKGTLFNNLKTF